MSEPRDLQDEDGESLPAAKGELRPESFTGAQRLAVIFAGVLLAIALGAGGDAGTVKSVLGVTSIAVALVAADALLRTGRADAFSQDGPFVDWERRVAVARLRSELARLRRDAGLRELGADPPSSGSDAHWPDEGLVYDLGGLHRVRTPSITGQQLLILALTIALLMIAVFAPVSDAWRDPLLGLTAIGSALLAADAAIRNGRLKLVSRWDAERRASAVSDLETRTELSELTMEAELLREQLRRAKGDRDRLS